MKTTRRSNRAKWAAMLAFGGILTQLIPFGCIGQDILRLVTPVYFDDTISILDRIVTLVAPLVLP